MNKYYTDEQGYKIEQSSIGCYETEKIFGDCIEVLTNDFSDRKFSLIITDPPYNIGWKYSENQNDNRRNYNEWCQQWADLCMSRLTDDGVFVVINYPENNNVLYTYLKEKGYNFVQQIVWHYNTNVGQSKKKYTRSYRTVLVFSKSSNYTFNAFKQEYKNPNDKRVKERIKMGLAPNMYDVWNINLCKNVSKDKKNIGINQLPRELCERLILTYSKPYDSVLDIFAGNFTVPDIATEHNRCGVGIDINNYEGKNEIL